MEIIRCITKRELYVNVQRTMKIVRRNIRSRRTTNFLFSLVFQTNQNGSLFQVKVAYAYTPVHDDELDIKPNDIIQVTRLVEEGWYEGVLGDRKGLFPSNYVTRITEETSKSSRTSFFDASIRSFD